MSQGDRTPPRGKGAAEDGGAEPNRALNMQSALRRLEEIARQLEGETLDLETSLKLYREARELHAFCVARLSEVEREAQILTEDGTIARADSSEQD